MTDSGTEHAISRSILAQHTEARGASFEGRITQYAVRFSFLTIILLTALLLRVTLLAEVPVGVDYD